MQALSIRESGTRTGQPMAMGRAGMSVQEDLEELRTSFDGCSLLAFADLGAQIVLVSSSAETARRDALDGLCRSAVALFDAAGKAHEPDADTALHCSGGTIEIYLRSPQQREDALCALCTTDTDVDGFLRAARKILVSLTQEDQP